jgi:EAL domain
MAALRALADLGVRIAIDDFSTGYTNLAFLQHLPVHTLKLAEAFVTGGLDHGFKVFDANVLTVLIHLAQCPGSFGDRGIRRSTKQFLRRLTSLATPGRGITSRPPCLPSKSQQSPFATQNTAPTGRQVHPCNSEAHLGNGQG